MARQPRKQPKATHIQGPLPVILVDGTRVRQEIKREYEKLRSDLDKARRQIEQFQHNDQPNYSRWLHSHFGALLTELRDTSHRVHELEQLFFEIQTEIVFGGLSAGQAYSRVTERRSNPESGTGDEDPFANDSGDDPSSFGNDSRGGGPSFEDFFENPPNQKPHAGRNPGSNPAAPRLKELYRALVRLLHPDVQKVLTAQKQEWWHQAQEAYEKGDVQALEVILSLCEIDETGNTEKTSLSILQRISAQLKKSLRQVKGQLAKCRRDPAWNFSGANTQELGARIQRELSEALKTLRFQLKSMEQRLESLASQQKRRRSPNRRRHRTEFNPLDLFF